MDGINMWGFRPPDARVALTYQKDMQGEITRCAAPKVGDDVKRQLPRTSTE
jgi:hypothetical protein